MIVTEWHTYSVELVSMVPKSDNKIDRFYCMWIQGFSTVCWLAYCAHPILSMKVFYSKIIPFIGTSYANILCTCIDTVSDSQCTVMSILVM